jgi:hypothetical protein
MNWEVACWDNSGEFYPEHQDFNQYYSFAQANPPGILLYTIFTGHRSLILEPNLNHQIKTRAAKGTQTIQLDDLFATVLDGAEQHFYTNPTDARYVNLTGICASVENGQVKIQQIGGEFVCYKGSELICEPLGYLLRRDENEQAGTMENFVTVMQRESQTSLDWKQRLQFDWVDMLPAKVGCGDQRMTGEYRRENVSLPIDIPLVFASKLVWMTVDEPSIGEVVSNRKKDLGDCLQDLGNLAEKLTREAPYQSLASHYRYGCVAAIRPV